MAKVADKASVRREQPGFGELPAGVVMLTLWFIAMALVVSLTLSLHVVASVLNGLYAGA